MSERHERERRASDETTCDDTLPASLAALLRCGRCGIAAEANGLCREHSRKRLVMIRNSARRADALRTYEERLVVIASNGRDQTLDVETYDDPSCVRVVLREVSRG